MTYAPIPTDDQSHRDGRVRYNPRAIKAMNAGLAIKALGGFCMMIGVFATIIPLELTGRGVAWAWTAWGIVYFLGSIPIVRRGDSRVLWYIWSLIMTLLGT